APKLRVFGDIAIARDRINNSSRSFHRVVLSWKRTRIPSFIKRKKVPRGIVIDVIAGDRKDNDLRAELLYPEIVPKRLLARTGSRIGGIDHLNMISLKLPLKIRWISFLIIRA